MEATLIPAFLVRYPLLSMAIVAAFMVGLLMMLQRNVDQQDKYETASAEEPLLSSKYDELITKLDKDAAANAYREQIEHLFQTWMKSPGDAEAPKRASVGARNARKAFIAVMEAIEKREEELEKLRELRN